MERRLERADHRAVEQLAQRRESWIAEAADDDRVGPVRVAARSAAIIGATQAASSAWLSMLSGPPGSIGDLHDGVRGCPSLEHRRAPLELRRAERSGAHIAGDLIKDVRHRGASRPHVGATSLGAPHEPAHTAITSTCAFSSSASGTDHRAHLVRFAHQPHLDKRLELRRAPTPGLPPPRVAAPRRT